MSKSRVFGWQSWEVVGFGLPNFGMTVDPLGREWKLNFMHNKPGIMFNPDGSLIAVIARDDYWTVTDPEGLILRPGNVKGYGP